MARDSDGDLARLRAEVTSKGGTTEAALRAFDASNLRGIVAAALKAATDRGREMAQALPGNSETNRTERTQSTSSIRCSRCISYVLILRFVMQLGARRLPQPDRASGAVAHQPADHAAAPRPAARGQDRHRLASWRSCCSPRSWSRRLPLIRHGMLTTRSRWLRDTCSSLMRSFIASTPARMILYAILAWVVPRGIFAADGAARRRFASRCSRRFAA